MLAATTFVFENNLTELERLAEYVEQFGEAHCLSPKDVFQVNLALDEVVTNVITYGYEDSNGHEIEVTLALDDGMLRITVVDDGKAFNPLHIPAPDFCTPLEDKEIGGLGFHFVRKVMKHVAYERRGNQNFLILDKEVIAQ